MSKQAAALTIGLLGFLDNHDITPITEGSKSRSSSRSSAYSYGRKQWKKIKTKKRAANQARNKNHK